MQTFAGVKMDRVGNFIREMFWEHQNCRKDRRMEEYGMREQSCQVGGRKPKGIQERTSGTGNHIENWKIGK